MMYAGKKSYTAICHEKKILSPEVWEKILTQAKSHPPLLKVKLSALSILKQWTVFFVRSNWKILVGLFSVIHLRVTPNPLKLL